MKQILLFFFLCTLLFSVEFSDKLPKESKQLLASFECFSKEDKTLMTAYLLALKYRIDHVEKREALVKTELDYWRLWHIVSDIENKCKLYYKFDDILEETIIQTDALQKKFKKLRRVEGSIHVAGASESSAKMDKYDAILRKLILLDPPKYTLLAKNPDMPDYDLTVLKKYPEKSIPKNIFVQIEKMKITDLQKDLLKREAYVKEEMIRHYDKPEKRKIMKQEMLYLEACQKELQLYANDEFYHNFKRKLARRSIMTQYYGLKTEFLPKEIDAYCEHNITTMKLGTFVPKVDKKKKPKKKKLHIKLENLTTFLTKYDSDSKKKKYAKEYLTLMKQELYKNATSTPSLESLKLLRLKDCLIHGNAKEDFALIMARVKDFRIEGIKERFYNNIFNSQRWWHMTIKMKIDAEGDSPEMKHFFDCNQTLLTPAKMPIQTKIKESKTKSRVTEKQRRDAYWLNNEILKHYAVIFENKPTPHMDNKKAIEMGLVSKKYIDKNGKIKISLGDKFVIGGMPRGGIRLTYYAVPKGKSCTDFIQSHSLNNTIHFNGKTYDGLDYIMLNDHKIKLDHYVYKHVEKLCKEEDNNTISFVKETTVQQHKYKGQKLGSSYDNVILVKSMNYSGSDIEISPDKKRFAITTRAKLFDTKTLSLIMDLDSGGGNDIRLSFSSDNHWLVVGNYHNFVSLWDMQKLSKYHKIKTERNSGNSSFIFLSDNHTLATQLGTTVHMIDIDTQKTLSILKPKWKDRSKKYPTGILSMAYSKENKMLYLGGDAGKIEIWDIADISNPKYTGFLEEKSSRRVSVLKIDPKDNNILISGDNKGIKFWNLKEKKVIRKLTPDAYNAFKNIAISDDHRYLIASGGNAHIWDLSDGKQIDILSGGGTDQAEDIIFLPNSYVFITIGGGSVGMPHMHLWEIKNKHMKNTAQKAREEVSKIRPVQTYKASENQQFFEDAKKGYSYGLYHYKNKNLNIQNDEGLTPLMIAVKNKYANVIRAFAEGKVDINLKDSKGKTAYDYVEYGKQSTLYGTLKYLEVMQMIKGKDKVVSYHSKNGMLDFVLSKTKCEGYHFPKDTKCHETKKDVTRYVDIDYFLNLRKSKPAVFKKVFPKYKEGESHESLNKQATKSFFNAIKKKDNNLFDTMIEHVDTKIKNRSKYSILWAGIFYKNYYVSSKILQKGADIYAYDPMNLRTPLLWAIQTNDVPLLKLLIKQGVDLNSKDKFGNPILFKSMYQCKSFDTIKMMLDKGADRHLKNKHGQTVFDIKPVFCKKKEDIDKMRTLLKGRNIVKPLIFKRLPKNTDKK